MLLNLNKQTWMDSLRLENFKVHCDKSQDTMANMLKLAKAYNKVRTLLRFCSRILNQYSLLRLPNLCNTVTIGYKGILGAAKIFPYNRLKMCGKSVLMP
jgi:hypothetical protein